MKEKRKKSKIKRNKISAWCVWIRLCYRLGTGIFKAMLFDCKVKE